MEDPVVFEEVHRFAFDLVGAARSPACASTTSTVCTRRAITCAGCRSAAAPIDRPRPRSSSSSKRFSAADEQLAGDWPVHGTTGYEFAAAVNNLFVDRAQRARLRRHLSPRSCGERRGARRSPISPIACKKLVLHETMSGDINSLGHQLNRFSERNRHFRDFTLYSLISTLKEVIASFPVYRTYVTADDPVSDHDRRYIAEAMRWRGGARRRRSAA